MGKEMQGVALIKFEFWVSEAGPKGLELYLSLMHFGGSKFIELTS